MATREEVAASQTRAGEARARRFGARGGLGTTATKKGGGGRASPGAGLLELLLGGLGGGVSAAVAAEQQSGQVGGGQQSRSDFFNALSSGGVPDEALQLIQERLLEQQLAPGGRGGTAGLGGGGRGGPILNFGNDAISPFGRGRGGGGQQQGFRDSQRRIRDAERRQSEAQASREGAEDRRLQRDLVGAEIQEKNRNAQFKAQTEARKDKALELAIGLISSLFGGGKK